LIYLIVGRFGPAVCQVATEKLPTEGSETASKEKTYFSPLLFKLAYVRFENPSYDLTTFTTFLGRTNDPFGRLEMLPVHT
jgi:hypothetical protein